MGKRAPLLALAALVAIALAALGYQRLARFPPEDTVEGAYVRIAAAVARDRPAECFAYLDASAGQAATRIAERADGIVARIDKSYPESERAAAGARYRDLASADGGAGVWALLAARQGWIARLRADLSGIAAVERDGERATVVTSRGTRYPFRRRPDGAWGLTLFTAELEAEAERIVRDGERIDSAGDDYDRVGVER
jgi:hypothetical protein